MMMDFHLAVVFFTEINIIINFTALTLMEKLIHLFLNSYGNSNIFIL